MSGGAYDYVMGNYNNSKGASGFSSLPESKYINIYIETSYQGHALTETGGWYGDYANFVRSDYPWFFRGGGYYGIAYAGVFGFYWGDGLSDVSVGFRLSIIK